MCARYLEGASYEVFEGVSSGPASDTDAFVTGMHATYGGMPIKDTCKREC